MHIIKLDSREFHGRYVTFCPYCKDDQVGPPDRLIYRHDCKDAGTMYLLNGFAIVGAPNYLQEEKQSNQRY